MTRPGTLATAAFALASALAIAACGSATRTTSDPEGATAAAPALAPTPPELRLGDEAEPTRYTVALSLDPNQDAFDGEVVIDFVVRRPLRVLWLHGKHLDVREASLEVAGQTRAVAPLAPSGGNPEDSEFIGFDLGDAVAPGAAKIRISYRGKMPTNEYQGVFKQEDQGNWYAYTQFEATGARRAFPSFDEPRWKIPFELTLNVPATMSAFANTPATRDEVSGETRTVAFAPTKPLPTYLVAFAVGPFEVVSAPAAGRNKTPVRIIVPKGRRDEAAYPVQVTGTILERLETYFDMAYPFEKLDSIAVPHFLGAMENPGLITYGSSLILSDPKALTMQRKRAYAGVAAHELAHQWFGNLVTLAWWDDIWLNESFATWLAAKVVHAWQPDWDGDVRAVSARDGAMRADSLISARKIRQPIRTRDDISGAFDAISYGKGAAVIAMFESWIGEDKFRTAMRTYMTRHARKTATAADFLAALGEVSEGDIPGAFATFLDQPGLPLVAASMTCEKGKRPRLRLEQRRFLPAGSKGSSDQTWTLPVCVEFGTGKNTARQCTLLAAKTAELELDAKRCPDWLLANADAVGYYRSEYSPKLVSKLIAAGSSLSTPERMTVLDDVSAMLASGKVPAGDVLSLVPKLLVDKNRHIVQVAAGMTASVQDAVPADLRPKYARFVRKMFGARAKKLGWDSRPGDSEGDKQLRRTVLGLVTTAGEDRSLAQPAIAMANKWLDDPSAVPADMVGLTLSVAAHWSEAPLYERLLAAAKAQKDRGVRAQLIGALGSFRSPELVERNLELLLSDTFSFREAAGLLQAPMRDPALRQQVYDFLKANFDTIKAKLPTIAQGYLLFIAVPFCDQAHRDDANAFFAPKIDTIPNGKRFMAQANEQMDLCIAQRKLQAPSLRTFLEGDTL